MGFGPLVTDVVNDAFASDLRRKTPPLGFVTKPVHTRRTPLLAIQGGARLAGPGLTEILCRTDLFIRAGGTVGPGLAEPRVDI